MSNNYPQPYIIDNLSYFLNQVSDAVHWTQSYVLRSCRQANIGWITYSRYKRFRRFALPGLLERIIQARSPCCLEKGIAFVKIFNHRKALDLGIDGKRTDQVSSSENLSVERVSKAPDAGVTRLRALALASRMVVGLWCLLLPLKCRVRKWFLERYPWWNIAEKGW